MKTEALIVRPESLEPFAGFFHPEAAPWEWIRSIQPALESMAWDVYPRQDEFSIPAGVHLEGSVYLHESVRLPHTGTLIGPAYIGANCELRPGFFIRGNVIATRECVLGNSCEFKNCLLLDGAQVPHFSYVGDSLLGNGAHLGAGSILSNLRFDGREVGAWTREGKVSTGLRKLGAILGDEAEIGSNAVLQPGAVLSRRSIVMTGMVFNGFLEPETLAYSRESTQRVRRRDL